MELSKEFRKNAAICLEHSREANSLEAQGYWIAMAQLWFDLVVLAEDRAAIESVDPASLPDSSGKIGRKSKEAQKATPRIKRDHLP